LCYLHTVVASCAYTRPGAMTNTTRGSTYARA
jgi:hypothetical protein